MRTVGQTILSPLSLITNEDIKISHYLYVIQGWQVERQ